MPEYIDKEKYCAEVCKCNEEKCDKSKCPVWNAPAADVAPVVHGRWLNFYGDFTCAECSKCGAIYDVDNVKPSGELFGEFEKEYKFCPNCGAKMDLEEDK